MEDDSLGGELTTVFASSDTMEIASVNSVLDEANIPYATKGEGIQSLGLGPFQMEVQVAEENVTRARELLADFFNGPELPDDAVFAEQPEGEFDPDSVPEPDPGLSDSQRGCLGFFVAVLFVFIAAGAYQVIWNPSSASIARHAKTLRGEGSDLIKNKDYATARKVLSRAIQMDPGNAETYGLRGWASTYLKEYESALADFGHEIALKPGSDWAFNERSSVFFVQQKYEKALEDSQQAIKLNPHVSRYYWRRGNIYLAKKLYDEALQDADQSIALDPSATNYSLRGRVYHALKDYSRAILNYDEVVYLLPKDAIGYYNRSLSYSALERMDEALRDAEKAVELDPRNVQHLIHRANLYRYNMQYDKAMKDCEAAIGLKPDSSSAMHAMALVLAETNETTHAAELLNHALEMDSTSTVAVNCHVDIAWLHNLNEEYEKARQECEIALALNSDSISAHLHLAWSLAQLGKFPDADMETSTIMRTIPERSYAYSTRGEVRRLEGNLEGALDDMSEAIKRNPRPEYYGERALVYLTRGKEEDAARDFEKCYGLNKYLKPRFEKWAAEVRARGR